LRLEFTENFLDDYADLPSSLRVRVDKALRLLRTNLQHPGLRARKMRGRKEIWEGRVSKGYRFTFQIRGEVYVIRRVGPHCIEETP